MAQSATGALAPTIFNFRSTAVRTTILDGVAWRGLSPPMLPRR